MTKRTKLLSLIVAAALCLVAGFAMMFQSTAKADVVVPTLSGYSEQKVDLDWSAGKNFNTVAVGAEKLTTDWFVFEYYIPAGTTNSSATPTFTFNVINQAVFSSYESINKTETDGEYVKTTFVAEENGKYVANSSSVEVKVVFAMDLVNGKVYGSVADAAFEEVASFENWAYVSNVAEKAAYIGLAGAPSVKKISNVKFYTEDGAITDYRAGNPGNLHHGAASFNADKITGLNMSAVKPAVATVGYRIDGTFNFKSATATTSDWIIFEYTIVAGTTYSNFQNGICTALSNDGWIGAENSTSNSTRSSYLHAYADAIPPQAIGNNLFAAAEDTTVKMAVNTVTGLFAYYRNGAWTTYGGAYNAAGISGTDRYFSIKANGATVNGAIKDVVCYDGNGVNLGVSSTMSEIVDPNLPASAVKPATGAQDFAMNGGFDFRNATATDAEWIIFEYTLGAANTYDTFQNGICTAISNDGFMSAENSTTNETRSSVLHSNQSSPDVTTLTKLLFGPENSADTLIKIAVNTQNGKLAVEKAGYWGMYDMYSVAGITGTDRYFSIYSNGSKANGSIKGLICYDSNGANLGVETSKLISAGTIKDDCVVIPAGDAQYKRFQGNVYFVDANGNDKPAAGIGDVTAKEYGTTVKTLSFVSGGGALQLVHYEQFGYADFNEIVNHWFLIEAGTMFGSVVLTEDLIYFMNGTKSYLFKADYEFAITYEGADAGSNPTGYIFGDDDQTALADPAPIAGKVAAGWFIGNEKIDSLADLAAFAVAGDVTLTAKYVTSISLKEMVEFAPQGGTDNRFIVAGEDLIFTDGTNDVPVTFNIGSIDLYDLDGEFVQAIDVIYSGGYVLIFASEFGFDALGEIVNAAYIIKTNTVFDEYILNADMVLYISATGAALMPATQTFAITYENLREATNGNAATYSVSTPVTLSAISKAGLEFVGWTIDGVPATEIAFPAFFGDVTVTATWREAKVVSYSAKIFADGSAEVYVYAIVNGYDNFTADKEYEFDAAKGMYKFTYDFDYIFGDTITLNIFDSSAQQIATATIDVMAYFGRAAAGTALSAEAKAVVADYIAFARALKAIMPEGDAYVAPAGATTVPTYTTPGAGEIGMRDAANYWNLDDMVFVTDSTSATIDLEINGNKVAVEVDEGEVSLETIFMGYPAFNLPVIGAKLTIKAFDGTTQLGNTLVINYAALVLEMADQIPAGQEAMLLVVERAICFYNSFAAYLAD